MSALQIRFWGYDRKNETGTIKVFQKGEYTVTSKKCGFIPAFYVLNS